MDPLRDDALIYEKVLREENGVETKVHMYAGLPHSFWSLHPEARFTKNMREDSVVGLKWLLTEKKQGSFGWLWEVLMDGFRRATGYVRDKY